MAAATPIPIAMAARFPLTRGTLARRLPLHALGAFAFVSVHLALDIGVQTLQGNMRPAPFGSHLVVLLGQYLATEAMIYAAVAGGFLFLNARREAEARARAAEMLRAQLSEARLAALQAQLAPHFLFNTLNAVSTLAIRGEREAVTRALAVVGDLLRMVLDQQGGAEVTLARELECVDLYLELQQMRFHDRLLIRRDIDRDTCGTLVPRLLLQPLVENAVRHSLEGAGGGTVTLTARRDKGSLLLEVGDRADGLRESARTPAGHRNGIGLANSRERLAALYGREQNLELLPDEFGTTVRIRLPWRPCATPSTA
jgi:LytS/YehU family sensor histidine kinase